MLVRTIRPYSEQEKKQLIARLPTRWSRIESFIGRFAFLMGVAMLPLLLINKYYPISPTKQLITILLVLILTALILLYTARRYEGAFSQKRISAAIDTGQAEVFHVKTTRAIERADPEDFGAAYYLEVEVDGVPKLLYLQGQYFDELEESVFPNTEFAVVRTLDTKVLLDIQLLGQPFPPEKVLPAFTMADWQRGITPEDGAILLGKLNDLT